MKVASENVIPVKTGIQKPLISLDSRLRGSDKLVIIRGSLKLDGEKGAPFNELRRGTVDEQKI